MNATIARLTMATLFGHRRGLLLFILPGVLLALCVLLALTLDNTSEFSVGLLQMFGLAVIVPLVSLLAATGALSSEIDDGSIVYLLSKPIKRSTIILTKTLVAIAVILVLGALPMFVAGLVLDVHDPQTAVAFGIGSLVAGIAYTGIFIALSVMSGNAVTIGLIYALLWEGVMGQYVDGARPSASSSGPWPSSTNSPTPPTSARRSNSRSPPSSCWPSSSSASASRSPGCARSSFPPPSSCCSLPP
ncbi:MAG: type transport system permease protein [Kribbellaceae bacterium]|nr:type transport system permease protein [Kribbellaceae bacterium]